MSHSYQRFDPFLQPREAEHMFRVAESFGSFGTYADEGTSEGLGEDLPQRFDVGQHYVARGLDGTGNTDTPARSASRTNYFRETYAYGTDMRVPEIKPFMDNEPLLNWAREMGGSDYVVPAIVYANLLIPGQELAIHTDVPEFRGLNRLNAPQWLLVCMHHSGLFEDWRVPILTCVSWFGAARGGAFTFYPDGPESPRESVAADHNTAILLDTDSAFHGVERVSTASQSLPPITRETRLEFRSGEHWLLRQADDVLAEYTWEDLRYSISWKGYCFADATQHELWRSGEDRLDIPTVLARFADHLKAEDAGELTGKTPDERAMTLVNHYIRFPAGADVG